MTANNPAVIFLCGENEIDRERRGYFRAFSRQVRTVWVPQVKKDGEEILEALIPDELNPILILHPDSYPRRLPQGIAASPAPTACFCIDTYESVEARIRFAMLFDYAFVFHPQFDQQFQQAGHPRAVCLPHAVEAELFQQPEQPRIYEVGWVGRLDGKNYAVRRRLITGLKSRFHMNDADRYYTPEEMATVYQQSKIVVNLSRDDYLQDANLRCFEAMASGALLMTPKPTELADLGCVEGVHYVTFEREADLYERVQFYLAHETERYAIAQAAQSLVLQEHTYDRRVQTILNILTEDHGQHFAPARHWDQAKIHTIYLRYFAESLLVEPALGELRKLRAISRPMTWQMLPAIVKAFLVRLKMVL
jgi:hypothetical protein